MEPKPIMLDLWALNGQQRHTRAAQALNMPSCAADK